MMPVDRPESDFATMRALHREASDRIDAPPNAGVRAAVLAEATKAIAATTPRRSGNPFGTARWPLSMAAVLVVSVMAGLVATRAMRDEPERVAPVVAAASPQARSIEPETTTATEAAPPAPEMKAPADRVASPSTDNARARAPRRPKTASPAAAPSNPAPPLALAAAPRQAVSNDASLRRSGPQKVSGEPPTPEAWVDRIVALRIADRADEADRELAALRLRYPAFVVPQAALGSTGTR